MTLKPELKEVCKCGKLLKAYTQKQLVNIIKKHQSSYEHKKRMKEMEEINEFS